jgi:uncharacterized membrane protein YjjP (DUF1212 family)
MNGKSSKFRTMLLAAGVAMLALSLVLLFRQHLVEGFLCAFLGLSAMTVSQSDIDPGAKHDARSFLALMRGRSQVSTLGKLCDISSYFCLAAALISWLALR